MTVYKTEDGERYPAEAFAYVPDPDKPSTWKLRLWESPSLKITRAQLGRAAAALSPGGFRGQRVQIPVEDLPVVKRRIRREYERLNVPPEEIPRWVLSDVVVERDAVLLKAGIYPDKGLDLTESDLDRFARQVEEIPLRVEHKATVFDGVLGTVVKLWREGSRLMGRVRLPGDAWNLIQRAGARAVSCGLAADKSRIVEVSLVRHPRVAGAAILSEEIIYCGPGGVLPAENLNGGDYEMDPEVEKSLPQESELAGMPSQPEPKQAAATADDIFRFKTAVASGGVAGELAQARAYVQDQQALLRQVAEEARATVVELQRLNQESLIERYKRSGKLTPAMEPAARAILSQKPIGGYSDEGVIAFADKRQHFADWFIEFLEAMPRVVTFGQEATGELSDDISPEALEFARKLGIDADTVRKHIGR